MLDTTQNPTTDDNASRQNGGALAPPLTEVKTPPANYSLTPRELEVLGHVADGKTNQEIADALGISVKTVEAHRARVFKKLGAKNAAQVVRIAIRNGLIKP